MKRFRIELSVGLLLMLLCLVSSTRTPRGFRPSGRKPGRYRTLQKAKGMGDDATMEPTVDVTWVKAFEKQPVDEAALAAEQEAEDKDDSKENKDKDKDNDDDDDETEEPTFAPTNSPSFSPSNSPSLSPNNYWVQATTDPPAAAGTTSEVNEYWESTPNEAPVSTTNDYWVSNAVEETDAPVSTPDEYWMQTPLEETDSPVSAPNDYWVQAAKEEGTDTPGPTTEEERNNPNDATLLAPTTYPTPSTDGSAVSPAEEAEPTVGAVDSPPEEEEPTEPYRVRLPPLYLYVNMQGLVNEENFLDVIVDYMQYYMEQDFQGFDSISYGATMFSMITTYSSLSKSSGSLDNPISNVTSHIHRLTATFENQPTALDWEVEDYMEMLLEDEVRMQEYVEAQPNLDFSVLSTSVEYEDTIAPTNVQANTANGATEEGEEQDDKKDMTTIIGWTVGAFVVLLWVVFLYGIQSRGEVPS